MLHISPHTTEKPFETISSHLCIFHTYLVTKYKEHNGCASYLGVEMLVTV